MERRRYPFDETGGQQTAAVIVAHPDDETLWAGGTILSQPHWKWHIVSLCRAGDPDRAPKFNRALELLKAGGAMADLDDEPDQPPLEPSLIESTLLMMLRQMSFDVVMTHGPRGEYTRHRRHEEVSRTVGQLWRSNRLRSRHLCMFAYEDGGRTHWPRPCHDAHLRWLLSSSLWERKLAIITEVYGFSTDSWEAQAAPREEAFWSFSSKPALTRWLQDRGVTHEDSRLV
jgi:LmbE family N-acetylglucosaminyl deacetylase